MVKNIAKQGRYNSLRFRLLGDTNTSRTVYTLCCHPLSFALHAVRVRPLAPTKSVL